MAHSHDPHGHDHAHDHIHRNQHLGDEALAEEQEQIAREIGSDLTEAFVEYVLGNLTFEDLTFGVFDALSDLNVVASGEYEIEIDGDDEDEADDDDSGAAF